MTEVRWQRSEIRWQMTEVRWQRSDDRSQMTVNRMNVEHRTSNIERPILMALRFIYFKISESRWRRDLKTAEYWTAVCEKLSRVEFRSSDSLCSVFILNWQNTVFDVGRSMFDVRPARNALKPGWGKFNHLIYISIFTRSQRTLHGRRVFIF